MLCSTLLCFLVLPIRLKPPLYGRPFGARVEVRHTRAHSDICYNGDLLAASPSPLELHLGITEGSTVTRMYIEEHLVKSGRVSRNL
jgi:hypothetical protein